MNRDTYIIKDSDIDFISRQLAKLNSNDPELIAQELMAHLVIANVKNGG